MYLKKLSSENQKHNSTLNVQIPKVHYSVLSAYKNLIKMAIKYLFGDAKI